MTNARKTLEIGTQLVAANGFKYTVIGFATDPNYGRVFFARLSLDPKGTAYTWLNDGASLSLGGAFDFPGFDYRVPAGVDIEALPVLRSSNGSSHQPVFTVQGGDEWLVYCITALHVNGGAYPWDMSGAAIWAGPKQAEWEIPELDFRATEEDNGMVFDEADLSEGLPALEALSDYLSVLMDGKLTGEEILTQILTAYQADEDR
jgi:hypothetical protein